MRVRFGIWDHFERSPNIPANEQYQEKIALVREAERLGFSYYHVAEHHLSPLDMAPSPSVFLAALAQATSRETYGEAERIARRSWPTLEEHWIATPVLVNEEGRAVPLRGASSRAPS